MKKNKLTLPALVVLSLFALYMSCSEKVKRPNHSITQDPHGEPAYVKPQATEEKELLGNLTEEELEQKLKENPELESQFERAMEVFYDFKNAEKPFASTYHAFRGLGAEPEALQDKNLKDYKIIDSKEEILEGGLRYLMARFDDQRRPVSLSFELVPFKGGFDVALALAHRYYPELKEPCYQTVHNNTVFQDGYFLITLREVTEDDIKEGHADKPRLEEDKGSVEVIMEYDLHPGLCGQKEHRH